MMWATTHQRQVAKQRVVEGASYSRSRVARYMAQVCQE